MVVKQNQRIRIKPEGSRATSGEPCALPIPCYIAGINPSSSHGRDVYDAYEMLLSRAFDLLNYETERFEEFSAMWAPHYSAERGGQRQEISIFGKAAQSEYGFLVSRPSSVAVQLNIAVAAVSFLSASQGNYQEYRAIISQGQYPASGKPRRKRYAFVHCLAIFHASYVPGFSKARQSPDLAPTGN
ncbi:hypothetical protein JB92DRAFT_2827890 [Gautieria morchelliformis]|nr:hypothetical protein JB92DRAFT_2827890 [Gautieria morchelliformis]